MSTSMISTVLEIEREAEAILDQAGKEAEKIIVDAKARREAAAKAAEDASKKEIAELEAKTAVERQKKIRELTAMGESALSAVKNVSPAAFDGGVRFVMDALAGKK